MDMTLPLSDEELEELENFLDSEDLGEDAMSLSALDGFLTALAIAPNNLPPHIWLPAIWGESAAWESRQQEERMQSLVFRHANDLLYFLRDEPESFEPLLYEREEGGKTIPVIDEWCAGFVAGMALDEESWQPLLESDEGEDMLYPILLFGTEAGWDELEQHPELSAREAEFAAMLGDCVMDIQEWALPLRKAGSTIRREQPKTGRNDLCPCGSGKKYKKCCGADHKLH
jgi:uncharacterized protein